MTEILKCVSDKVVKIPPGCSVETKWKFIPIEAKTYKVKKELYNLFTLINTLITKLLSFIDYNKR